ncbi:hypothetical protein BYT27DRAFT_6458076 [Phlegmacium glaucopus]|nr:hypothetical protein BYT27DRAFT_6458076 [Phlegmacium glaucopus]
MLNSPTRMCYWSGLVDLDASYVSGWEVLDDFSFVSLFFCVWVLSVKNIVLTGFGKITLLDLDTRGCRSHPVLAIGKDHALSLEDQINAIGPPSPPRNSKSPVNPGLSFTNPLPTVKPQRGRSQKAPTALEAPSTLSTKDMFNFSSSSNLTYDSFWSSHTGPTVPQSTRGSYTDSFADYPPTFPSSGGDYNNGISTTSRPSNNPISTSNNVVPQPNPDLQRNLGVPV